MDTSKDILDMKFAYYYGGAVKLNDSWKYDNIETVFSKLYFVLDGRLKIETDSEVIIGTPNTLILIPAGLRHSQSAPFPDKAEKLWMHFNIEIGNKSIFDFFPVPLSVKVTEPERIKELFHSIFSYGRYRDMAGVLRLQAYCYELLSCYFESAGISHPFQVPNSASAVLKAAGYIQEHLSSPPPVSDLAEIFHFNTSYFIRIFKKQMGLSPHQYIMQMQMERAKNLLENSELSVAQIARSVGYEDSKHFSRTFRKYAHYSPTEYRTVNKRTV
ncbi:MAG: helix-turn-helix domain-containing protein [Clostridia bacterium]|nr:helix-turn-helix domain-containing protein [Clostridia bacterium]